MLASLQYVCTAVLLASKVNHVAHISDHRRETVQAEILNKFLLSCQSSPLAQKTGRVRQREAKGRLLPKMYPLWRQDKYIFYQNG